MLLGNWTEGQRSNVREDIKRWVKERVEEPLWLVVYLNLKGPKPHVRMELYPEPVFLGSHLERREDVTGLSTDDEPWASTPPRLLDESLTPSQAEELRFVLEAPDRVLGMGNEMSLAFSVGLMLFDFWVMCDMRFKSSLLRFNHLEKMAEVAGPPLLSVDHVTSFFRRYWAMKQTDDDYSESTGDDGTGEYGLLSNFISPMNGSPGPVAIRIPFIMVGLWSGAPQEPGIIRRAVSVDARFEALTERFVAFVEQAAATDPPIPIAWGPWMASGGGRAVGPAHPPNHIPVVLSDVEEAWCRESRIAGRFTLNLTGVVQPRVGNLVFVDGASLNMPDAEFVLLVRLAYGLLDTPDGFIPKGTLQGGGMADDDTYLPEAAEQAFTRLRKCFRGAISINPTQPS